MVVTMLQYCRLYACVLTSLPSSQSTAHLHTTPSHLHSSTATHPRGATRAGRPTCGARGGCRCRDQGLQGHHAEVRCGSLPARGAQVSREGRVSREGMRHVWMRPAAYKCGCGRLHTSVDEAGCIVQSGSCIVQSGCIGPVQAGSTVHIQDEFRLFCRSLQQVRKNKWKARRE